MNPYYEKEDMFILSPWQYMNLCPPMPSSS